MTNGSVAPPYDLNEPSPIGRLLELRSSSSESVVRSSGLSPIQRLMARPGVVEERLWNRCVDQNPPDLILLTGSAGCGKTATIGHLLNWERDEGVKVFGETMADATHADSPDQEQVSRLAKFFSAFQDGSPRPGGPCRLIAINTGMVMKFFSDLRMQNPNHDLQQLEAHLAGRLRLPGTHAVAPPDWMGEAVLVVNLDLRPTAGQEGDVFDSILSRLDPADSNGVLGGTPRCNTCKVADWCWPMANAATLSAPRGRRAINQAAGAASLRRGRELPPRALWDVAADLALSGLETLPGEDPCAAIADVAHRNDTEALLLGLAGHRALQDASEGTLLDEIAASDPTFQAGQEQHEQLSTAGLDPAMDARQLSSWLSGESGAHPAVQNAAAALATGNVVPDPRAYARAAWLGGAISGVPEADEVFERALQAQAANATLDDNGPDGHALQTALLRINDGLAKGFGLSAGVETFFPTEGPGVRQTDVLVRADLLDDEKLSIAANGDPSRECNPAGADIVGYRQLALALSIGDVPVSVDYPLWNLLRLATDGTAPSTVDLDRYLSLRRAIGAIGRAAGSEPRIPLLVVHRTTGRRYRVAPFGPTTNLRATEVE